MPALAILRYELGSLWSGWLVRLWLIAAGLVALLSLAAGWGQLSDAILISSLLFPFLVFPWFLIIVLLGISPVTGSRLDALADGILSRPITRYEYLLASWAARVLTVLGVFLLVIAPCALLAVSAQRPPEPDTVTWYGAIAAAALISLVMVFLVSVGFLAGTLLRRPLVAAVVLIFVWYPINVVLHTFSLEEFSPISLNQALPTLLRTPWRTEPAEQPALSDADAAALERQAAQFLSLLSGVAPPPPPRRRSSDFFDRGDYEDFSFWSVSLGYGLPTLAAVVLATWCFCRRDL